MDKEKLLKNIKKWIEIDDDIKKLNKIIKQKRENKKKLTEILVNTMKSHNIDCFNLSGGNKLIYTQSKYKKQLSKKHLLTALGSYFKDNEDKVRDISQYILTTREYKIKDNIRRK